MADINTLLEEAKELKILNIDVNDNNLSKEVIQVAINATKRLNSKMDNDKIAKKILEAELNCPTATALS